MHSPAPSTTPAPSFDSASSATSDAADEASTLRNDSYTAAQTDILQIIKKVLTLNVHPVNKLAELRQRGIIKNLMLTDFSTSRTNCIAFAIRYGHEIETTHVVKERLKKKDARLEAATELLDIVSTHLFKFPPSSLHVLEDEARPPTAAELKIMATDRLHLDLVCDLTALSDANIKTGVLSIDLEQYILDHSVPLEVGVSFLTYQKDPTTENIVAHHIIVEDNEHIINKRPGLNHKHDFHFGVSQRIPTTRLASAVTKLIRELTSAFDTVYLVGHTVASDLGWLRDMKVSLPEGLVLCDIGKAYRAFVSPDHYADVVGMQKMMDQLGIRYKHLHNGGNDAYYNIEVLLKLISVVGEAKTKIVENNK